MAATIKVGADLGPAQKAVDGFQEKLKDSGQKAGENLARGVESGASKAAGSLKGVENAAKEAAGATKKLLEMEQVDRAVSAIGPLKDIFSKTGEAVFGLKKETVETVTTMGDLAEKGAQIGKLFGPWGAIIGAAIGAIGGYFAAAGKQAQEAQEKLAKLTEETKESFAKFKDLDNVELGGLIAELEKVRKKQAEIKQLTLESGNLFVPDFADTVGIVAALSKVRKATKDEEDDLQDALKETQTILADGGKKQTEEYKKAEKAVVALQNKLRDLRLEATTVEQTPEALDEFNKRYEKTIKAADAAEKGLRRLTDSIMSSSSAAGAEVEDTRMSLEDLEKVIPVAIAIGDGLLYVRDGFEAINKKQAEIGDLLGLDKVDPEKLKRQTDAEVARINSELPPIELPLVLKPVMDEDIITGFSIAGQAALADLADAGKQFLEDALAGSIELLSENIAKGEKAWKGLGDVLEETAIRGAKALGKKWALQAGGEAAEAIASLAVGNIPGATLHGQAAIAFGLMAAAAGVGAGLLDRATGGGEAAAQSSVAPAPSFSSSGGSAQGGSSSFEELPQAQVNIAPGGTVVFAGDNRGRAQYGRFNDGASRAGRAGAPGGVRR